jgi:hypothetical protein
MYEDYLGDAVYVHFDGFSIWLTANKGSTNEQVICLEPDVYLALTRYVERLKAEDRE